MKRNGRKKLKCTGYYYQVFFLPNLLACVSLDVDVIYGALFGKTRTGNDYAYFKRLYSKILLKVTVQKNILFGANFKPGPSKF